MFQIFDTLLLL